MNRTQNSPKRSISASPGHKICEEESVSHQRRIHDFSLESVNELYIDVLETTGRRVKRALRGQGHFWPERGKGAGGGGGGMRSSL